jgi:hypothetical protein
MLLLLLMMLEQNAEKIEKDGKTQGSGVAPAAQDPLRGLSTRLKPTPLEETCSPAACRREMFYMQAAPSMPITLPFTHTPSPLARKATTLDSC